MTATVIACPFKDTDSLADAANAGMHDAEARIATKLTLLKTRHPESATIIDQLDDAHLEAVTHAQNATIRQLICKICNRHEESGCSGLVQASNAE